MPQSLGSPKPEGEFLKASRWKLARGYALGMAVGLVVILAGGYWVHSALVKQALKTELQQLAHKEAGVHLPDLQRWAEGQMTAADVQIGLRSHRTAFYYILSSDSELVHGNETQPELRSDVLGLLKNNQLPRGEVVFENLYPEDEPSLRLALLRYPVKHEGAYLGSVYAATDVGGSLSHLDQLLITSFLLLIGLVFLASVGGWWMADRSLQPLRLALQQQRRFIADASHELRAPLTVMTTALTVVRDEAGSQLAEFHRETLDDALDETRRLSRLAEELLLLARADAAAIEPVMTTFDPAEILQQKLRLYAKRAEGKGLQLVCEVDESVPIRADQDLFQRMLDAALENALTYTPAGGEVLLKACREKGQAAVLIADTGPGMSPEEAERAFQRFYRADPARQRNQQGAGLGLALIHELAELQGATAELVTSTGEGTRLYLYFRSA
ncbi:His Kinase A (phospho-acceptor) domain-containing protein [Marinospirillum celere]|uniref:histidine kinase n=1 Tax=Marinospirillum celere TaxID=1122252 RepID=A0A1I1HFZ7_9GAMM|nr:ATP-binding protein [Marinospirillum celere]SFC20040.1 His Kinase A (phospho-acceptor) domain-containing protein [Marinospirillum celere]